MKSFVIIINLLLLVFGGCKLTPSSNSSSSGGPTNDPLLKGNKINFTKEIEFIVVSKDKKNLYLKDGDNIKYLAVRDSFTADIADNNKWKTISFIDPSLPGSSRIYHQSSLNDGIIFSVGRNGGDGKFLTIINEGTKKQIYSDNDNQIIKGLGVVNGNNKEHIFELKYNKSYSHSWFNDKNEYITGEIDEKSLIIDGNDSFYVITKEGIHTISHNNVTQKNNLSKIEATANNSFEKQKDSFSKKRIGRVHKAIFNNNKLYLSFKSGFGGSAAAAAVAIFDTTTNTISPIGQTWDSITNPVEDLAVDAKGDVFALTSQEIFKLDEQGEIVENIANKLDKTVFGGSNFYFSNFVFVNNSLLISHDKDLYVFPHP